MLWNRSQALKMVFHLTAAAYLHSREGILDTVAGTTCNIHSLQNVDMLTLHLACRVLKAGRCQEPPGRFPQI